MASDTGGRRVLSRQLHSSIFHQANTMGFSYFRNVLHKIPHPLFPPPPPRGSAGIASRSCTASLWKGRGDVCKIALYPARETPPVFPLPPGTPPSPSLVVGPPQQQRLQPQHRSCLIAPASRSSQQGLPRLGEKIHRIDTATAEAQQLQRKYLTPP